MVAAGPSPPSPASAPRRRAGWIAVLIVAAVGIFVGVPLLFCVYLAATAPTVERGTVISVRIDGEIAEGPSTDPLAKLAAAARPLSLHDLRRLVRLSKDDARVAGLLLEIGPIESSFGVLEEVQELVAEFKTGGKPVAAFLYGDFIEEKPYLVATSADRIVANPEAGFLLNGLTGEVAFWRGTLEKLRIEPQFILYKEYKSAGEPFSRKEMSPAFREWLTSVLTEYHHRFLDTVASRRGIDRERLARLLEEGGQTAKEAADAKLLDGTGYLDEVIDSLRTGSPGTERRVITGQRYLASKRAVVPRGKKVAVVYATGPISSAPGSQSLFGGSGISGPDLAEAIHDAAEDASIEAIVMRVESPGGSAVGSDFIRREIERAKAKKPFVVSMSGVAGSGGYWISMDADAIVAQPSTLTGSIGVVFGKFNLRGFYEWIGANVDGVKVGQNADLFSPVHSLDSHQLALMNEWMTAVYESFVDHVAKSRGMSFDEAEKVAHGRVWTGSQAKERKLVDELGGFATALSIAKQKAGIPESAEVSLVVFPKEKPFLEALLEGMGGASAAVPEIEALLDGVERDLSTPKVFAVMPTVEVR